MPGEELTNAAVAVQLALFYPEWVQRRVEQIAFLDDRAVRVRERVSVRWPEQDFFPADLQPSDGATIYAPLDLIAKSPLVDAQVCGADGDALTTLDASDHRALVVTGLTVAVLSRLTANQQRSTRSIDAVVEALDALVMSPPSLARPLHARIFAPAAGRPRHPLARALDEPDELHGLVKELTASSLLLVPATYHAGVETVLEYGYVTSLSPSFSWRSIGAACGLQDHRVEIPDCLLGCCDDYQVEVVSPEGVQIARARLVATYVHEGEGDGAPARIDVAADGDAPVVALHPTRPPRDLIAAAASSPARRDRSWKPSRRWRATTPSSADSVAGLLMRANAWEPSSVVRSDSGTIELSLRPPVGGTFLAGAVASLLTAILLAGAYLQLTQLDGASGVTLLLALPILAAGYLTRPGEHAFASRLLLGVRASVLVAGVCSLVFAAILGSGTIERTQAAYRCVPATSAAVRTSGELRCSARRSVDAHVPAGARAVALGAVVLAGTVTLLLWVGVARTGLAGTLRRRAGPSGSPFDDAASML